MFTLGFGLQGRRIASFIGIERLVVRHFQVRKISLSSCRYSSSIANQGAAVSNSGFATRRVFSGEARPLRFWKSTPRASQLRLHHSRCHVHVLKEAARSTSGMEFSRQGSAELSKSLWGGCRKEAFAALYHPFMVSLAAGTLPKRSFQQYIAQDFYFLEAFKNAYQMAMEKTDDKEAKATIGGLKQAVQEELTLHSSLVESWGLDPTDLNISPNSATKKYCDFLQAMAKVEDEDQLDDSLRRQVTSPILRSSSSWIITAMTPCMRLYAFLGQEIEKYVKQVSDHPYQEWIDTYSSVGFEVAASQIEMLLDKLTESLQHPNERSLLEEIYRRAMTLEVDFFSAQPLGPVHTPFFKCGAASSNHLVLVSDFDSTCTIVDSCPVLADLTVQSAGKLHGGDSLEGSVMELRKQWDDLVRQYMDEYSEVLQRSLPLQQQDPSSVYLTGDLRKFLEKMSEFEHEANSRVEDAAVLKGLSLTDIQVAGSSMLFQDGCAEFLKRLSANEFDVDVHILSVCWSKAFIEGALAKDEVQVQNIHANELVFDGNLSNGRIIRNVETALDKERHFIQIVDGLKALELSEKNRQVRSVYVGDSLTDLLCLLTANVGIVLGNSSTLKQVYGEGLIPLYSRALHEELVNKKGVELRHSRGYAYTVSCWHEVEAFLLGSTVQTA